MFLQVACQAGKPLFQAVLAESCERFLALRGGPGARPPTPGCRFSDRACAGSWRGTALFSMLARTSMTAPEPSFPDRVTRAVIGARRWVVLAMLLSLHLALVSEPE